ncbi:hypothetical protein FMEAI12_3550035 [Parafrankia sp. Ea1.12]|nr:hypothetical protein FMEAI12_3550035 [Parafrankia sp. Ea1.12]
MASTRPKTTCPATVPVPAPLRPTAGSLCRARDPDALLLMQRVRRNVRIVPKVNKGRQ